MAKQPPGAFRLASEHLTEEDTLIACEALLQSRGYWTQRIRAGVWFSFDHKRVMRIKKGTPDLIALHGSKPGILVETKRPHGGVLSQDQVTMQRTLTMGYRLRVCNARTAQELRQWLDREGGRTEAHPPTKGPLPPNKESA